MISYAGRHAELYDLFYSDKPYAAEAAFVDGCLREFSDGPRSRLLDVACGTGRHSFEFERLGYQVLGVDYSPDMLERGRQNAQARGSSVKFRLADMRELSLGEDSYDAVSCLFDSIGFARTTGGVLSALRGMHLHLRPGGLLVFEFWHGPAFLRHFDPVRVRRWRRPHGEVLRISETSIDFPSQLANVRYSVYELDHDHTYHAFQESQTNRFFHVAEMSAYLAQAEFSPLKWFAGCSRDENISDQTWHVVAVARKSVRAR